MRKYRLVEIVTPYSTLYAIERKMLGLFWVQVDRESNIIVIDRVSFGIYDDKEIAEENMASFIYEEEYKHAIKNNRKVIECK